MGAGKTNAMRILDNHSIEYGMMSYDARDGKIDGVTVAEKIGKAPETVFKTLVTHSSPQQLYVFVIPVETELDMKKAAKAAGAKKMEMLAVKDLQKNTGYIRGGCSPIGMKKQYPTFIDESAFNLTEIIVSAGKIGSQIVLKPADFLEVTQAESVALIK
ncbi:Cys-tRNA(Pro) deacylase [Peribacillus sp. SI8-4]|uniref:Cys-tRNA(Pro) deacylase n=1 Tax=Peribacillus sp. SI8-4 TaxID=3048009 RepID=UPI00255706C1|nr:Cys-tRNA(Pro) deacylase [Peribacillus sp. SI8-4]